MELQRVIRDISLMSFVIVMWCQTSTIRADDWGDSGDNSRNFMLRYRRDNSNELGIGSDSSEEVIQPAALSSATAALFSTVAMTRRAPRASNRNQNNCIGPACGSDGNFYNDTCTMTRQGAMLMPESFCNTGCGKDQPDPCPNKKVPVCAGSDNNYHIYEDECQLNKTRCDNFEVKDILIKTKIATIGKCQREVNATKLTCHDILRAKCPRGTMSGRVCDAESDNTYKNICRVLHRRCKKQDDTCFNYKGSCRNLESEEIPTRVDCTKYIAEKFSVITDRRPCFIMPSRRKTCGGCARIVSELPIVPQIPEIILEAIST